MHMRRLRFGNCEAGIVISLFHEHWCNTVARGLEKKEWLSHGNCWHIVQVITGYNCSLQNTFTFLIKLWSLICLYSVFIYWIHVFIYLFYLSATCLIIWRCFFFSYFYLYGSIVHFVQFIIWTNQCSIYTGYLRRKGQNFGRVFLMWKYTDITQNTCVQIWTVTEIMARE